MTSNHYRSATTFDPLGHLYELAFKDEPEQLQAIQYLLTNLPPNSQILDIGSGTGRPLASTLSHAGHSVLGIDVSDTMLTLARANVPSAHFEKVDVRKFTAAQETFDAVTLFFAFIDHVTQDDIRKLFPKVHAWLKPGGIFVYATLPLSMEMQEIRWLGRDVVVSGIDEEETLGCLRGAGFEVLECRKGKFLPKAAEVGICGAEDVWEEEHLFVYARK